MNREPIGLYIFRFIMGFGLFAFMCMLYWSSALIENDLKSLRFDLAQLKNELFSLHSETEKIRTDVLKTILEGGINREGKPSSAEDKTVQKIQNQRASKYPNLLTEDPFFKTSLPKLLGENFKPTGIRKTAGIGKPQNLHPFSNWLQISTWIDMCTVSVSRQQFGIYETMSPDMALRMEERINPETGLPEFWIFLRDNVYWQPLQTDFFSQEMNLAPQFLRKNQVTAEDFKFYYDAMMNPSVQEAGAVALRTYYGDITSVEVIDKLTFVVRWKTENVEENGKQVPKIKYVAKLLTGGLRPLASFVYKYFPDGKKIIEDDADPDTYLTNSVWAQNFAQHWAKNIIVSCGAWVFDGMGDRQIAFKRNPDFFNPYGALSERLEFEFKDTPESIWQIFKANQLDSYTLQPEQIAEFEKFMNSEPYLEQKRAGFAIRRLDFVARSYSYIGWNQAKPYFKEAKVRQAMTMAIDRQRIIRQNLNGMGIEITGTFYRYSPAYDTAITPWPFDVQKARQLLEEEGWYDSDGDGVIDKEIDGVRVPFRFSLTYYVKNSTVKSICEYIATALREVGIEASLNGVDIADLSATFEDKSFDALCLGWSLGTPPDDPKQLWYSSGAKEKGSSNAVGFANKEADEIIDKLQYEYDPEKRIALYHRFDAILHEEQPYTFLYTPKTAFLYREYLQNVFLPVDRQDLVPGANVAEPDPNIFWLKFASGKKA